MRAGLLPTMTKGSCLIDFGDTAETTPLLPMHSLCHNLCLLRFMQEVCATMAWLRW